MTLSRFAFIKILMKLKYITQKNSKEKVKQWTKELQPLKDRHSDFVFESKNSALLVIDMQKYFIDEDADAFIPVGRFVLLQVKKLVEGYSEKGFPVIFTRYGVERENAGDMMRKWWGEVLLTDNPQSLIVEELDTGKGTVIVKPAYSAFFETNLEEILRTKSVKQLLITGVMTHLCCETTARDAFQRGYEVYFVIDGTGTYNEEIHKSSLRNLAGGFAVPVTTEEILKKC